MGEIISISKLWDQDHFDQILEYNLKNIEYWKGYYPNHGDWIESVVDELKSDSYNRIAFGGFDFNRNGKFCCSVIVKKDPFSPYLEIKNLIVMDDEASDERKKAYQNQVIRFIISYSQQRGYPKLVTEVFNRNKIDKDLIKVFLENNFSIAGNHFNKYGLSDEVIYMTLDVDLINGNDPYDDVNSAKWIVAKYLNAFLNEVESVDHRITIVDTNNNKYPLPNTYFLSFYYGKKYPAGSPEEKFNMKGNLVIIPQHFKDKHTIHSIRDIRTHGLRASDEIYVFDFSADKGPKFANFRAMAGKERFKLFTRPELDRLLDISPETNGRKQIPLDRLGGIVLISNPKRFPIYKIGDRKRPAAKIYIKLGDYGMKLESGMLILFAYYFPYSAPQNLKIWGSAELSSLQPLDIRTLTDSYSHIVSRKSGETKYSKGTNAVYNYLEIDSEKVDILWDRSEFEKHNRYNATNKIIAYKFFHFDALLRTKEEEGKRTFDLDKTDRLIDIADFLDESTYNQGVLEHFPDHYLSVEDIERYEAILDKNNQLNQPAYEREDQRRKLRFLFVSAEPDNRGRTGFIKEEGIIKATLKGRVNYREAKFDVDFGQLHKLVDDKPNILHFSGHGAKEGIFTKNPETGDSQLVSNKELKDIFARHTGTLRLLILNSCFSEVQAKGISTHAGILCIGFKSELTVDDSLLFAEHFYGMFQKGEAGLTEENIILACKNFIKVAAGNDRNISIWQGGRKIPIR